MQIVIEMPEDEFEAIYRQVTSGHESSYGYIAIAKGAPLPKGHGRLIDADAFLSKVKADRKHSAYARSWTADDILNVLNNSYAPTIIEADKENKE